MGGGGSASGGVAQQGRNLLIGADVSSMRIDTLKAIYGKAS